MDGREAQALSLEMFRKATPVSPEAPIAVWRQGFEEMAAQLPLSEDVAIESMEVGGVLCLKLSAPGVRSDAIVIHFHSGGYVMGSAHAYRQFGGRLSAAVGAPVLLADYRLAPEHPYPAPVEDALALYRAVIASYAPGKVVLSGDSAGGGLCVSTLLNIRDQGLAAPACALAICPLLDLAGEGESAVEGLDPLIDREMIVGMGKVYIGERDPHAHPLASPLWGRHQSLPPLFLTASTTEALRDDSVRLARSIEAADGVVHLSLVAGEIHIWTFFPFLKSAASSLAEIGDFARRYLG